MAMQLPPLGALRLFEAAGRHQSFKRAAEELHLTPGAVSHGIQGLERWLGLRLFQRTGRGLALTVAGRDYLPYVTEALTVIAVGTQRLPSRRGDRRIMVSSAPSFASRLLLPGLHRFRARHPRVVVAIDTSHRQIGFPVDGVDLAIRMGRAPWPGLESVELMRERLVPVCAPAYRKSLRRRGRFELERAVLLQVNSVTEDWPAWLDAAGIKGVPTAGGLQFDTIHMALQAAVEGLGVAIGRRPLVDRDLAEGRLVEACGPAIDAATGYWLVSHPAAEARPDIAAFKRWLVAESQLMSR
jgi:LysR family transcriptional regulator, glycine cleavage system transcriptional activator